MKHKQNHPQKEKVQVMNTGQDLTQGRDLAASEAVLLERIRYREEVIAPWRLCSEGKKGNTGEDEGSCRR